MKLKIIGAILLSLIPIVGMASGNGVYEVYKVGCTTTDGRCWITLSTPVSSAINNCVSGQEARFFLSDPGSNAVLSLAMTAYTTGKKLEIYTLDGANCIDSYPKALHVSIAPE